MMRWLFFFFNHLSAPLFCVLFLLYYVFPSSRYRYIQRNEWWVTHSTLLCIEVVISRCMDLKTDHQRIPPCLLREGDSEQPAHAIIYVYIIYIFFFSSSSSCMATGNGNWRKQRLGKYRPRLNITPANNDSQLPSSSSSSSWVSFVCFLSVS